jgi:hypothetical protein
MTDDELYDAFTAATLKPGEFRHRDHVRVGFLCLRRHGDLAAAAIEFRTSLRRLATALGAPGLYHETLTWAYLILIHARTADHAYATSDEFLAANADLLDHKSGALAQHYDVAAITASPLARRCLVLP